MATKSTRAKKTKKETLEEAVAEAVGAGRELHLESVDFSDPNRPKTCLEVDFPIVPVNQTSSIEAASGAATKPVYRFSKWWARRQSSVFRSLLLSAAARCPDDQMTAASSIWDAYYANHQKNEAFRKLKVADIFMGGGTTIVEGARLGMQMFGNDLNPVAWLVVKNELAQVDPREVQKLLDVIEVGVKPQIMPFYACDCPCGHKGKWTHKSTGKAMGTDFDPLSLMPEQRSEYEYEGPEVIYTFWAKHGPCQASECNHRTPIMPSQIIATKELSLQFWRIDCRSCGHEYHLERFPVRIAPSSPIFSTENTSYAVMSTGGRYCCPNCGSEDIDETAQLTGKSARLGPSSKKTITSSVVIAPHWLQGCPSKDHAGHPFGGSSEDTLSATLSWLIERGSNPHLIEIRGDLTADIKDPASGAVIYSPSTSTVPKKSHFECSSCGQVQDILEAMTHFGKTAVFAPYATQVFCPTCASDSGNDGRYYTTPNIHSITAAWQEWNVRSSSDLEKWWPRSSVPEGFKTSYQRIPEHGYPRFVDMHNPRQRLVHSLLLRTIEEGHFSETTKDFVLGSFQQYLRYNCGFTFWHLKNNQISAFLSNNNYPLKNTIVETGVYSPVGDGSWSSAIRSMKEGLDWLAAPWELVAKEDMLQRRPEIGAAIKGKSEKVYPNDRVGGDATLFCESSTAITSLSPTSVDLVITDPPFGNNIQYSELADFFYVWLRLALSRRYEWFVPEFTPKAVEAVANPVRHPTDPDAMYGRLLAACWAQAFEILKPGGILAFTFHHSEEEPWIAVLKSLFDAGFYLEATYPIRSDGTRGEGAKPGTFGSQLIEYDILHVCRKRLDEPEEISWARLRRQIMRDVRQLQEIIEQHQKEGLGEADLQVIRRGKALEYYSKHYGKVYVEKGRDFTVREALVGINTLLDDERDTDKETPPVNAEPYTRQFLRLFAGRDGLPRDQMQKFLRGTGVSPAEFESRGWCKETQKVFHVTSPLELAREWKGQNRSGMARDFDQAMFLVGACYPDSGIRVQDTLDSPNFKPHVATPGILDWLTRHGGNSGIKSAAKLAKQLYERWMAANEPKVKEAQRTFDFAEDA